MNITPLLSDPSLTRTIETSQSLSDSRTERAISYEDAPKAPLSSPASCIAENILSFTLGDSYEDDFYQEASRALSGSLQCGSHHANTMLAGLAVAVLHRFQNLERYETLKFIIIDRIAIWTSLTRLNASKIAYLSHKIFQNRNNPAYIEALGYWSSALDKKQPFIAVATRIILWWKSSFPKKFSFYQIQMKAAELEKQTKEVILATDEMRVTSPKMLSKDLHSTLVAEHVSTESERIIATRFAPTKAKFASNFSEKESVCNMNDMEKEEEIKINADESKTGNRISPKSAMRIECLINPE